MVFRMRRIIISSTCSARSSGFTFIEAVVVASLVGIVTAFAVPHFTRLANSVRAAEVTALGANLRHAAQTAHAQFLAPGGHLSAITMGGKTVTLRNGYPDATAAGICNAVFDSDGFTASEDAGSVTFMRADAPSGKQCSVTYKAAPEASSGVTITDPDTSGC
jgi:type II secretory pathway pseudopilin PulG